MTDPVPDTKTPRTRWMWVGVIALLAVVAVIMFINPMAMRASRRSPTMRSPRRKSG